MPESQSPEELTWNAQVSDDFRRRFPDAFAFVRDDHVLPRVLLIGDSISIGYTPEVRRRLEGIANVHRPPANCASTKHGLAAIDDWLGSRPWALIHFNWGLHDVVYLDARGERTEPGQGTHQVPIEQYERNLKSLVHRLAETGATLIWASTTPIPAGSAHRQPGDEIRFNAVAAQIMREQGVLVNDLNSYIASCTGVQHPADVHFTPEGYALLGARVAQRILSALRGEPFL